MPAPHQVPAPTGLSRVALLARQAVRAAIAFRNWPVLLGQVALARTSIASGDVVVKTRSGLSIACRNRPGAWAPLVELFVDDRYRVGELGALGVARPVVVDIGARIGAFSLSVARLKPGAAIWCYEPYPKSFDYLSRNILVNGFGSRIHPTEAAVGSVDGTAIFCERPTPSRKGTSQPVEGDAGRTVKQLSFAWVVSEVEGDIDLVKLDCAGSEFDIVLDSPDSCWARVGAIVLEHHEVEGHSFAELEGRLSNLGYWLVWHDREPGPELGTAYFARRLA